MMQVLHTKRHGDVTFKRTWVNADGRHIGALAGGGYAHLSGLLVEKKKDLTDLIPLGPDREAAYAWWDNKDVEVEPPARRVMLSPEDGFTWDDGSSITSAQSLIENLPRGPELDMMLEWFHGRAQAKTTKEQSQYAAIDASIEKNRAALAAKKADALDKKPLGRPRKT